MKHTCNICGKPRPGFICRTCHIYVCIHCVFVTVICGKWNFYCSEECANASIDDSRSSVVNPTISIATAENGNGNGTY